MVCWASHAGTIDFCSALLLQSAQYKIFFSSQYNNFNSFVPIAQQAGQAARLVQPSLSMCIWYKHKIFVECHHFIIERKLYFPTGHVFICATSSVSSRIKDTCYETGYPARLPTQLTGRRGQINWNSVLWGSKYLANILYLANYSRAAKAWQKSLVPAHKGRTPFNCTPWVSICLSCNSQQGPPLSSISEPNARTPAMSSLSTII